MRGTTKGFAARLADGGDRRAQDGRQVGDASAAGRDPGARAARHLRVQTGAPQPSRDYSRDVRGHPRGVQLVHELQKGAFVPHTVLSHDFGG